ncbi:YL1 nuclear protein-domain-containing protein [Apiospora sp. TS-2023a]
MATEEEDQRMSLDQIEDGDSSDSSSEDGDPREVAKTEEQPVEWLATSRAKRSTAGNRMKSMLAIEEPDDDLELLFAEDGEDGGFTDVDGDASDVQMDSSSDDDDDGHENADEDEGEKELARQARESKQAARKRKAQEAIPMKFRKKVKISTDTTSSVTTTPAPRPKRKSERASWLPSTSDMPTRASKRETTMLSKEQLHQQMLEREAKRLKQVDAMERKAKRMEALKKPPMTQAERLAEAALVEKRNAKSLNRWEEAEKQREAERRAKLAALNNRQLSGPVVTFWSGMGEWIDGKLKHVGKIVTIEEKPVKKKRTSTAGVDAAELPSKDEEAKETGQKAEPEVPVQKGEATQATVPETTSEPAEAKEKTGPAHKEADSNSITRPVSQPNDEQVVPSKDMPQEDSQEPLPQRKLVSPEPKVSAHETDLKDQPRPSLETPIQEKPMQPKPAELKAPDIKPPDMKPPDSGLYTTSMFAPPAQLPVMKPPEMKPPTNSYLAPPPGARQSGLSMPVLGYSSPSPMGPNSSNVLAPPMSAPRQSPLAAPQPDTRPSPAPLAPPAPSVPSAPSAPSATPASTPPQPQAAQTPSAPKPATPHPPPTKAPSSSSSKPVPSHTGRSKGYAQKEKALPPPRPPTPPPNGKATRNCILLQNFNENAIAQKTVQNRILFGKDMPKLAKPGPAPRCVITNHLARYRDPETGLPYYNSYAYKQIQKLKHGDYKWSQLVGAWVGSGSLAATGVPARFLDPDAPAPPKVEAQQPAVPGEKKPEEASQGKPGEAAPSTPAAPTTPATPTGAAQTTPSGVIPGSTSSVSLSKATETTQSKPTGPAMTPATRPPAETQAGTSNHPPPVASVTEKTVPATHHSTSEDVNSEASGSLSLNAPVVPVESGPVRSTTSPVGPATPSHLKTSPTSTSAPALIPVPETAQEGEAPTSASAVQTPAAVQQ